MERRRARLIDGSFPSWAVPNPDVRVAIRDRMLTARDAHRDRDLYHRELAISLIHPLVTLEAEDNYARASRAGVALRHPFLDPDVVRTLARTPPELLTRGGRSKGPIRNLVARELPGLGFEHQKKIVATPFTGEHLLDNVAVLWSDLGGLRCLAAHGLVDQDLLNSEVARIVEQRDTGAVHRLWYLMTLESWVRSVET
jgi:asparagine synthetase B (glutamine-hydrolysing)